jgi:hypothetical protein
MRCFATRSTAASVTLVAAAGPGCRRCGGVGSPAAASCLSKSVQSAAPGATADWTLPGGNLANNRDVASPITSSNVTTLPVLSGGCRSMTGRVLGGGPAARHPPPSIGLRCHRSQAAGAVGGPVLPRPGLPVPTGHRRYYNQESHFNNESFHIARAAVKGT